MAGEVQVLHLPFAGGLDELVSKEYLDASARQSSILNGEFAKAGAINKRTGLEYLATPLVPGGSLAAPTAGVRAVGWSRSSLSLLGSGGFYQHTKAPVGGNPAGGLVGTGALPSVGVVRRPLPVGGISGEGSSVEIPSLPPPTLCDLALSDRTLRIVLFRNPYDIYAVVQDADTGDTVLPPVLVSENGANYTYTVAAFALPDQAGGPVAIAVFHDTDNGSVKYSKYDPATNEFGALVTLVAADAITVDAAPYEDDPSNGWLLLYDVGGSLPVTPGTTLRLAYWTLAGLQTSVDQSVAGGHTLRRGASYVCGRYGASVWSVWKTTDGVDESYWTQRRTANTALTTATSPFEFQTLPGEEPARVPTGIAHLGTDKIFVSFRITIQDDGIDWGTYRSAWRVLSHSAGTVSSLAFGQIPLGLIAESRPFVANSEVYQSFVYNLNYTRRDVDNPAYICKQPTLYLCKFFGVSDSMAALGTIKPNKCFPVATVAPRQVFDAYQTAWDSSSAYHLGFASSASRDATRVAVGIGLISSTGNTVEIGSSWAVDFLFGAEAERGLYQTSELGSELSISSGVPFVSDGETTFEDGFFNFPEFIRPELTSGSSLLPTGDYTFAVIYESTDAAGLTHRSAPFILDPYTITFAGPIPRLYIPSPMGSYRDFFAEEGDIGKVSAEVYMTTANGATLYYHGSIAISNVTDADPDDPWLGLLEYNVYLPPKEGAKILYTTGGVLDHVNPPASSTQITHQKRKALVDETRRGVWLTKQFSSGLAPGFNEALYIDFPEGEDIVALGSLDSRLIAFKKTSIWYIDGQGPSPNGLGASWTDPERIPSDVGCKSWQSVVATPNGLMFQGSDNGIYLLGRDLTVSFIGRNVVDSTTDYPNIVSAVIEPVSSHVRFLCLDAAEENHLVVIYDHLLNAWTTHRYDHMGLPTAVCMSTDTTPRYTILSNTGQLWQERLPSDTERYLDEDNTSVTHFVATVVKLPFVKLQVQGYHRARRVQFFGEHLDDCGFQIQMAFNYDDTVKQTATWSAAQLDSLSVKGQVEAYVGAAYNKQMSLQLTFSDTPGTAMTSGAGMRFASAAIELQNLGSRYKLLGAGARR